ncbi:MAG TPA: hypothetical protein VJV05_08555 [Pyrinomonadaceae bacterium]|nr:hypothetical protein [Pyrinomonadaceae bacterium]
MRQAEVDARSSAQLPREKPPTLTEDERNRIRTLITPNVSDVIENQDVLSQPGTGIFRLFPNSNCESRMEVRVDGPCARHVPGASSYSFRSGAITPDLHFNDGWLIGDSFFSQIVIARIGNLPLVNLASSANELSFLNTFEPAPDIPSARLQYASILKGIESDGVKYSKGVLPQMGMTYAMRIVAYRNGNNLERRMAKEGVGPDHPVMMFKKLEEDNRADLLVAFRIVRKEEDGNITIVWKELSRRKAPTLRFAQDEEMSDLK